MKSSASLAWLIGLSLAWASMSFGVKNTSFAAELQEIERRGKLIVGVKTNLRPLGFYDEAGKLQGLEIDIARRLAEEMLGSEEALELRPVNNLERLKVVLEGEVDITIAQVGFTSSRDRVLDFSPPYYIDGTGIVTKDEDKRRLQDFAKSKIAVLQYSATIAVVRHHLPQAELVAVSSYQEALQVLETGQADAFAGDSTVLAGWVQEYSQYQHLPLFLSGQALAVVMPHGLQYQELSQQVNQAVRKWQDSGWLKERAIYWGLPWLGI